MNNEILDLFRKYVNNQCSKTELDKVLKLIEDSQYEQELAYVLSEQEKLNINYPDYPSNNDFELLERINASIEKEQRHKKAIKLHHYTKYVAAAVLAIISGVGIYMFVNSNSLQTKSTAITKRQEIIATNNNKAYLTLANGKRIALSSANLGALANELGVEITKTKNGELVYKAGDDVINATTPVYNKIEIPNGEKFQLYLPDGTKVWLNAGTTLRYPVSFKNLKERGVELDGEAYFEVVHNKAIPFRVYVGKNAVEVLGTKFNVNSYHNEPSVNTTLIDGSVKVISDKNNHSASSVIIKPGEQASITANKISINKIDPEEIIAWKNGDFIFKNQDFETVMRSIGRWYDLDIVYENENPIIVKPGGWISRRNNVHEVLEMIEATGKVKFKIEGRRIIVRN